MMILVGVMVLIMWLVVGILAERSMNDLTGGSELPYMVLPLRIVVILLAPILFLVFERHIFFKKKLNGCVTDIDGRMNRDG
ncbi:hypothetical protein [Marinobacterium weihaiense]|uniref:Uncharacterized protein n=1 Tax=Marinobacterium weihaiense TaxID=2851016 RepID=A0ABS6MBC0_9GAMM|nr:hypothetical protein [Marinobacterium weihaiense]MBV0933594.1 hypothetical protein [Marinobacterium weihaiense]